MKMKVGIIFLVAILYNLFQSPTTLASDSGMILDQDWKFYEQQLITSEQESEHFKIVDLPIEFDELTNTVSTYGTFIKKVEVPSSLLNSQIGIELPFTYSASAFYINGEKLNEVGKVSSNMEEHETDLQSVIIPYRVTSEEIEIAVQISSYHHIRGGFSQAPTLGDWNTISKEFVQERYMTIFIATIILVVGCAALAIGLWTRTEKTLLVFGLFAIVVACRAWVAEPFIYHDLPIALSYEWATKLEYITTTICFALYALFVYVLYNKLFSKWMLYLNVSILLSLAVLTVFTTPEFFQKAFFSVFPVMMLFVIYNLWIMIRAFYTKMDLAKSLLIGVLFVLTGLVVDFLTGMGVIHFPPLAHLMIAMNVILVLFSICRNYVLHVNTVKRLNTKLDEIVYSRTKQLKEANKELKLQVNLDPLTGIYNRHKFNESLFTLFQDSIHKNRPISLMMLDIDEFKKYNDYYGHVYGDTAIIEITRLIQEVLPEDTLFARYGGEEFVVILANYDKQQTLHLAEAIRTHIEASSLEHFGREEKIITVSIGCSERIEDRVVNENELIRVADERLYISKNKGRNHVTV